MIKPTYKLANPKIHYSLSLSLYNQYKYNYVDIENGTKEKKCAKNL